MKTFMGVFTKYTQHGIVFKESDKDLRDPGSNLHCAMEAHGVTLSHLLNFGRRPPGYSGHCFPMLTWSEVGNWLAKWGGWVKFVRLIGTLTD